MHHAAEHQKLAGRLTRHDHGGGNGTERYFVRYSGACIANPRSEIAVGFESRDFQTCPYGLDALMIDGQRCTIWDIWDLPPEGANTQQPAS